MSLSKVSVRVSEMMMMVRPIFKMDQITAQNRSVASPIETVTLGTSVNWQKAPCVGVFSLCAVVPSVQASSPCPTSSPSTAGSSVLS